MRFAFVLFSSVAIAGGFTTSLGDQYPYTLSAITTDAAGNTYVVGSRRLGTVNAFSFPRTDVFVAKISSDGNVLFTDTFAGNGVDTGSTIALDPAGNIYIAGKTSSQDFPLVKALQSQPSAYGTGSLSSSVTMAQPSYIRRILAVVWAQP